MRSVQLYTLDEPVRLSCHAAHTLPLHDDIVVEKPLGGHGGPRDVVQPAAIGVLLRQVGYNEGLCEELAAERAHVIELVLFSRRVLRRRLYDDELATPVAAQRLRFFDGWRSDWRWSDARR